MTPTMWTVGFDVSLRCTGWAALDYDTGHLEDCGAITTDPGEPLVQSLEKIALGTAAILTSFEAADVGIEEGISHRNGEVTRKLAMAWAAVATTVWRRLSIEAHSVKPAEVKKAATGNGSATKDEVVMAAVNRWDLRLRHSDMADAAWVAELTRAEMHAKFPGGTT